MNYIQLDECSNATALALKCEKERLCGIRRYPDNEQGTKDPKMLTKYMSKDGIVLTFDCRIVDQHGGYIPNENPGIIMIGSSFPRTLTYIAAQGIMHNFKSLCNDWHLLSWKNSIVKITETSVEVGYMRAGKLIVELRKSLTEHNWQDDLRAVLAKNVIRHKE